MKGGLLPVVKYFCFKVERLAVVRTQSFLWSQSLVCLDYKF
jgi:hypothetical protein